MWLHPSRKIHAKLYYANATFVAIYFQELINSELSYNADVESDLDLCIPVYLKYYGASIP